MTRIINFLPHNHPLQHPQKEEQLNPYHAKLFLDLPDINSEMTFVRSD